MLQKFLILATSLSVLHSNYFNSLRKLLSYLYSAKILDLSAKPFFPSIFFFLCFLSFDLIYREEESCFLRRELKIV